METLKTSPASRWRPAYDSMHPNGFCDDARGSRYVNIEQGHLGGFLRGYVPPEEFDRIMKALDVDVKREPVAWWELPLPAEVIPPRKKLWRFLGVWSRS